MTVERILNKWANFTEYNPEQRSFNLGTYWVHQGNDTIKQLFNYDDTGILSLLYAKQLCKRVLKESRPVSFWEIIEDPSGFKDIKSIWEEFSSPFVVEIEENKECH